MMNTDSIDIARILASTRHCRLSREQLHCLADVLECKKYKKGERILDENEVCTCLRYIEKGMTRQFYFKYNKDLTEHIAYEGGIVMCLESYLKSEPSRLMIETLENSVIWEIPKTAVEKLSLADAEIGVWYRRVPAHERYVKLMQLHPEILKRAPLVYIASLLQMSPETLSRVRSASLND